MRKKTPQKHCRGNTKNKKQKWCKRKEVRKAVECVRQGENTGKGERCQGGGDLHRSKHQRAVVMGLDHPSGLAGSPLRPSCARFAWWNGCTDRLIGQTETEVGVMINAVGTICWKH